MTTLQQTTLQIDLVDPRQLDASDESDGWYTPRWMIDAARLVLGRIDLDPATCAAAQAIVQAETWYTATENGLVQPWYGAVWCNPPYSDPLPWAERMTRLYQAGEIEAGMMLVNCSCSPKWAQLLWRSATAVCLFGSRMNFWHPTKTNANGSYDRDSAVFYFGPKPDLFAAIFERYGVIR
jgi:ParB family chromosome partitioning protein